GHLLPGIVEILVAVDEHVAELVAFAFEFAAPPGAGIVDGGKHGLRALIHREAGCEVPPRHRLPGSASHPRLRCPLHSSLSVALMSRGFIATCITLVIPLA